MKVKPSLAPKPIAKYAEFGHSSLPCSAAYLSNTHLFDVDATTRSICAMATREPASTQVDDLLTGPDSRRIA